ncbi:hypothetical protein C4565_06505 [Candidatus Parcubacteria bacterium]|nr:MAG: hypothetical protein C4565_06505 [Candidatus Parcubacteria bacterium]
MKSLLSAVILLCILIYALAFMAGGSKLANKFLNWLKKQFVSFLRWIGSATTDILRAHPMIVGGVIFILILLFFFGY